MSAFSINEVDEVLLFIQLALYGRGSCCNLVNQLLFRKGRAWF